MSLRVAAQASLLISQDNSSTPQEITFTSGIKSIVDTTSYSYSTGDTYKIPANSTDLQVSLGSLAEANLVYLFAKGTGLTVKFIPLGHILADVTTSLTLAPNSPTLIGANIVAVYVSNPGVTDIALIFGAAGN